MEQFVAQYTPRLEQFLDTLEQVEAEKYRRKPSAKRLSELMRKSWTSGEFWFNFASKKSLDVDAKFYRQLDMIYYGGKASVDLLDDKVQGYLEPFVRKKMVQKRAYEEACASFPAHAGYHVGSGPTSIRVIEFSGLRLY
ncbi:hypothetical protein FQN55_004643 [Onygenales sp. PD_40]|nr:hypothetical protein FQN55_004643 [Onygenales sp. PD_40]